MAYPELRLLGTWTHTGTLAANTSWAPPALETTDPQLPQGYLAGNQVGEVAFAVIYSPVEANGTVDDLSFVRLVLDGQVYPYIVLSGRQDTAMAAPLNRIRRGKVISFGQPTIGRNGNPGNPLEATCPKFIKWASIEATAGATAVNANFIVQLYGYAYDAVALASQMPEYSVPNFNIQDALNNRTFKVMGRLVEAKGNWKGNWKTLMGGTQQQPASGSVIHPLVRFARNANATSANSAYQFQYQNSSETPAVAAAHNNLYFDLAEDQAILAKRFGIRSPQPTSAGAALAAAWIQTGSEQQQRHPQGGMDVAFDANSFSFGLGMAETNKFDAVPELPQGDQLLWNEVAYPTVVDNGKSVAANAVMIAFAGLLIENGAGNPI